MIADAEVRDRYLSLALDSRKIIDALVVFVEEGRRVPDLEPSLLDAVESLRRARGERSIFAPLRTELGLEHYEQLRMVDQVSEAVDKQKNIIAKLSDLLNQNTDVERQKTNAFDAINFFYALERQALHYYSEPFGPEGL